MNIPDDLTPELSPILSSRLPDECAQPKEFADIVPFTQTLDDPEELCMMSYRSCKRMIDLPICIHESCGNAPTENNEYCPVHVIRLVADRDRRRTCIIQCCYGERVDDLFCEFHRFCESKLEVRKSTIPDAGLGLFSGVNCRPGQPIPGLVFAGPIIRKEKVGKVDGTYLLQIDDEHFIDASDPALSSKARYINDVFGTTFKVNAKIRPLAGADGDIQFIVYAIKHISTGDEIFISYGEEYWKYRPRQKIEEAKPGDAHYIWRKPKKKQKLGKTKVAFLNL